ncbi:prevent-host-death family protein [Pasteurellaceae bacterium LFhippo2]|nr:prevent-host-death family protein [Pasteurellaceae bacterium LFhippo2]
MAITVTSKEFNQSASKVLKMSAEQPIFITKWGKVVSVLSSYQEYQQAKKEEPSFEDIFALSAEQAVSDEFFAEFEQTLVDIRKSTKPRVTEFE